MFTHRYEVPVSLGMPYVLSICREVHAFPIADAYELDFSNTQHFEPFGMLLLASAIRRLNERDIQGRTPMVLVKGKDMSKQGHQYARHLGFWWSIGDEPDLPLVRRTASDATIPITRISYADLFKKAGGRDPIRAEVVRGAAEELATTLSGGLGQSELWGALRYSFHEMFRNAFEHGRTDSIWYTAATRPTKDDVQIAILDAGRGVRVSLADNPNEQHASDVEAIRAALQPGVSRNTGRVRSHSATEKLMEEFPGQEVTLYDNSGYGLTVACLLGREAGQFAIVSGDSSVAFVRDVERVSSTTHVGTAIRLVLNPSKVDGALDRALSRAERNDRSPLSRPLISASKLAQLGFKPPGR